ncbi:MAG: hypothetical protein Solivirus2_42 [Solivirus sp.]|uniref:Uncharacterized protein n=1 Tax=Solivirus sp. TaxID=2487772 RepID=A0A3G5AI42_9VIRU|nr:MAG: hypothetical protein Solivirus2_42 [Solivirus sp.]
MALVQIESAPIEDAIYENLLSSFLREVCTAYGLTYNYSSFSLSALASCKKTFPNLCKVLQSNRTPYTVMSLSAEIGMYIPASKRYGLVAFEFYLSNIKYYETILFSKEISLTNIPTLNDLLSLPDNAILKPNFNYSINYSDRLSMLKRFLKDNFTEWFELPSNSRTMYNSKNVVTIFYKWLDFLPQKTSSSGGERIELFTTDDLLTILNGPDIAFISRYTKERRQFSPLALLDLRGKIIEKICKWRIREGNTEFGSARLYKIYQRLDKLLENAARISSQSYFQYYLINFNPI